MNVKRRQIREELNADGTKKDHRTVVYNSHWEYTEIKKQN